MLLVSQANQRLFERVAAGSVVTIGAFDGMHVGHQRLLKSVVNEAQQRDVPSVVMSFEPTPKEFFSKSSPPARLMRFREKFDALRDTGIDVFFCPRFNAAMRDIKADAFIRQLLIQQLNTRHLVIGDDFGFAARREGNIDVLQRAGRALNFSVEQIPSVMIDGERVSSTVIREALERGDLDKARRFLGHYYRMSGKVVQGKRLGRKLGYPTANVNLNRRLGAVHGIFAVRVSGLGAQPLDGVASVGTRPTFAGTHPLLEVHLFDFNKDIYGRYIHVDFVARLRDEEKYDDAAALIEQMHRDSATAREILAA